MDEDNAIGVALLKIGRSDEESDVQADADQRERGGGKPRNHPPCQRVEGLWRRILEPVDAHEAHLNVLFQRDA